jgi:periplasmic divalent cation tolerance protein
MTGYIIVFCTISSLDKAKKISYELVNKKLAACVNIINGLTSIYEWKGEVCTESECLMVIKTRKELFDKLKNVILSIHPYNVPEIVSFDISDGLEPYLNWIKQNTE